MKVTGAVMQYISHIDFEINRIIVIKSRYIGYVFYGYDLSCQEILKQI